MKYGKIINILLLLSLVLFLPLGRPPVEFTTIPLEDHHFVINIQTDIVEVSSNINDPILLIVSYVDPSSTNSTEEITNTYFRETIELDLTNYPRGDYLFTITAERIASISINQTSIGLTSYIIVAILVVSRIIVFYRERTTIMIQ